jgi:hypothetical protein
VFETWGGRFRRLFDYWFQLGWNDMDWETQDQMLREDEFTRYYVITGRISHLCFLLDSLADCDGHEVFLTEVLVGHTSKILLLPAKGGFGVVVFHFSLGRMNSGPPKDHEYFDFYKSIKHNLACIGLQTRHHISCLECALSGF